MGSIGFVLTLVIVALSHRINAWSYTDQQWGGLCDGGKQQSPIKLNYLDIHTELVHWGPLMWTNNYTLFGMVTLKNNGHGFSVSGGSLSELVLTGGGLKRPYVLAQYHYHWGATSNAPNGSEHTFFWDGRHYAGELHLVHYDAKYMDMGEALQSGSSEALAVVGVRLDLRWRNAKGPEISLVRAIDRIRAPDEETNSDMSTTTIHDLVPHNLANFFLYEGSLTTPPCNEQVVWTVLDQSVPISKDLMNNFHHVHDKYGNQLKNTARHTQKLNGRQVYYNVKVKKHEPDYDPEHKPKHDAASSLSPFVFTLATAAAAAAIASF